MLGYSEEDTSDLKYEQVLRKSMEVKDVRKHSACQQLLFLFQLNSAANLFDPFLLAAKPFNNKQTNKQTKNKQERKDRFWHIGQGIQSISVVRLCWWELLWLLL